MEVIRISAKGGRRILHLCKAQWKQTHGLMGLIPPLNTYFFFSDIIQGMAGK